MITNVTSWSLGLCPNTSLNTVEPPVRPRLQSDHTFFQLREKSVLAIREHRRSAIVLFTCQRDFRNCFSRNELTQFAFDVIELSPFVLFVNFCKNPRSLSFPAPPVSSLPSRSMPVFHNIAAYKFAPLDNLKDRRAHLLARCKEWNLKGTILLSTEGINLFVAGRPADIQNLIAALRAIPGLGDFPIKLSESKHQPFNRMLVRIKKEIIAFGVEGIDPGSYTSPRIAPATLKRWLDEGRPVTLLDTRND